ncbi:MAG: S41 family peptidase [Candidatus Saccharimonadales bacterium]|nr:S41 family peptidase [Candidatus Saccharimonadales bacterium]
MERDENIQPEIDKSSRTINLIGYGVIIAVSFFILGNRWTDIFNRDSNQSEVVVSEGLPEDLDFSSAEELYDILKKRYDGELSETALLDGIKEGLARASGDSYTVYLNEEEAQTFRDDLNGTFTGIGAEIGLEEERLIIVAPLAGFPAEKAGLRPQDIILEIDGEDTFGMSVEEAVSKIRGEKGTSVILTVFRTDTRLEIEITRDEIVVPSVDTEILDNDIGYIRLSRFAEDTTTLMNQAAQEMLSQNVKGIILDLRNNSGGFLNASVDVLDLWIDSQVVVQQRRGEIVNQELRTKRGAILGQIPTVVLINEGSASASEIVAGAMQDYEVATLVGQQTFGKGSVQSLEELDGGGVLKVTIARWYTPSGNNIDESGITPSEIVEFTEEDFESESDPQRDRAVEILSQ